MTLGTVIASRKLTIPGPKGARLVVVRIGKPRRQRTGEWACPFRITGLSRTGLDRAFGVDAIQALQLALEGIRIQLEAFGGNVTFEGSPLVVAFPRQVPSYLGPELANKLNRIIDREERRTADRFIRRGKAALAKRTRAPRR